MTHKQLVDLIKILAIFFGVMLVMKGIITGCVNIKIMPAEHSDPVLHYFTLPIFVLLDFSYAFIGWGFIQFHAKIVQLLMSFAGKPRWNRRYVHALVWVCLGGILLVQMFGSLLTDVGITTQKGIPLSITFEFGLLGCVILVIALIPGVFLILGAKWFTRQVDRSVLSPKK